MKTQPRRHSIEHNAPLFVAVLLALRLGACTASSSSSSSSGSDVAGSSTGPVCNGQQLDYFVEGANGPEKRSHLCEESCEIVAGRAQCSSQKGSPLRSCETNNDCKIPLLCKGSKQAFEFASPRCDGNLCAWATRTLPCYPCNPGPEGGDCSPATTSGGLPWAPLPDPECDGNSVVQYTVSFPGNPGLDPHKNVFPCENNMCETLDGVPHCVPRPRSCESDADCQDESFCEMPTKLGKWTEVRCDGATCVWQSKTSENCPGGGACQFDLNGCGAGKPCFACTPTSGAAGSSGAGQAGVGGQSGGSIAGAGGTDATAQGGGGATDAQGGSAGAGGSGGSGG